MLRRLGRSVALWSCSLLLALPQIVTAQQKTPPDRLLVVDWNKGAIAVIGTADGVTMASHDVDMKANGLDQVLPSPDGSRIVVAHRIPISAFRNGRPMARAKITILDANSLTPLSTLELGWGRQWQSQRWQSGYWNDVWDAKSFVFDGAGRLHVLFPGFCCVKDTPMPPEAYGIDLKTGQMITKRELPRSAYDMYPAVQQDKAVLVLDSLTYDSARTNLPHKPPSWHVYDLSVLDLGTLEMSGSSRVQATERPLLVPGGDLFFVEEFRDRTRLHVFDGTLHGEAKSLDVDGAVRGIWPRDAQRVLLFVETGKGAQGRLLSIRHGAVETTVDMAAPPRFVVPGPDGKGFYVGHAKALLRLNDSLQKVGEIATPDEQPKSLVFSKNGRRAFLTYSSSDRVTTIDVPGDTVVATSKTGSSATKFLQGMVESQARSALFDYELADPLQRASMWQIKEWADATIASIHSPDTHVLLHPEGTFAYVLNQKTSDVTIIDQATGKSVGIVGAGGNLLRQFGPTRAASISDKLELIDLTTNKKADDPEFKNLSRLTFTPDRAFLFGLAKEQLVSVDAREGKVLRSVTLAEPKRSCSNCSLILLPSRGTAP